MKQTFEQIKERVLSLPNSKEELERINEELELFEAKGWNTYIAFAINFLKEIEEKVKFFFPNLSVMDSLFVNKALHPNYNYDKFLSKKHSKDILFNDALRLSIDIVYADNEERLYLNRLTAFIFKEYLARYHLYSRAKGVPDKYKVGVFNKIVCAISPSKVPNDDFSVVFNEQRDGPREEINILNKYFLVYITSKVGI